MSAFAIELNGEAILSGCTWATAELSRRSTLDGVGNPLGAVLCIAEERSKNAARGVVRGR